MNEKTERAPRTMKHRIYTVEDGSGGSGFYYATSTTQAKSMHAREIEAREATEFEIMDIGRRGLKVIGLPDQSDEDDAQSRFEMEPPTGEEEE